MFDITLLILFHIQKNPVVKNMIPYCKVGPEKQYALSFSFFGVNIYPLPNYSGSLDLFHLQRIIHFPGILYTGYQ